MNYISLDSTGKIAGYFVSNESDYAQSLQDNNPHFASVHVTEYSGDIVGKLYDPVTDTVTDDPDYVPPPPPEPPLPTLEDYDAALTAHLDSVARQKRYADRISCSVRAGYPGPFQAEGIAFATWMDTQNAKGYQMLSDFQNGLIQQPTIEEFISQLDPMEWP